MAEDKPDNSYIFAELLRLSKQVQKLNDDITIANSEFLHRHRQKDIIAIELFMTLSSTWVAYVLLRWHPVYIYNEHALSILAAVAVVIKVIAMIAQVHQGFKNKFVVILPLTAGLAMSGVLWTVIGFSILAQFPHPLFGFPALLMGSFAWWALLRVVW